jgi:uncharacterized protein (DUF934 family)
MIVANRQIKAKAKASPDRIQSDIRTKKVIVEGQIVDNHWLHLAESSELTLTNLPSGEISVPLDFWLEHKTDLQARSGKIAVQLASDQKVEDLLADLAEIDIVVLPFVSAADGRAYSHAYLLRVRHLFIGEIRAVGDVHYDQLAFLARVGFNAFEMPDKEIDEKSLQAMHEFSRTYQPAADGAPLIFATRRRTH